jgi:hypothetical protein
MPRQPEHQPAVHKRHVRHEAPQRRRTGRRHDRHIRVHDRHIGVALRAKVPVHRRLRARAASSGGGGTAKCRRGADFFIFFCLAGEQVSRAAVPKRGKQWKLPHDCKKDDNGTPVGACDFACACLLACSCLRACSDARAPMCSSPPKKPLGEILASDQDAHKLATSERATEDLLSRLKECERRLKQCSGFAALVKSRADDPAAVHLGGQEQDRYGCVRLLVARPLLFGDPVALECRARMLQRRRACSVSFVILQSTVGLL